MLTAKQTAIHPRNSATETNSKRICPLNPMELRKLWGLIEQTQSSILLGCSDTELIQELIFQMEAKDLLDASESNVMRAYLHSRILLIRDFARARTQMA